MLPSGASDRHVGHVLRAGAAEAERDELVVAPERPVEAGARRPRATSASTPSSEPSGRRDDDRATAREVAHAERDVVLGRRLEQARPGAPGSLPATGTAVTPTPTSSSATSRPSSRFVHVT